MSDESTRLTEDDVVDAVSDYLERAEWTVEQRLRTDGDLAGPARSRKLM